MRQPVEALWGRWREDEVRGEIVRAVTEGEYQAIMDGDTRVGVMSVLRSETCCEIAQLFIAPRYQRRGFGRASVDHVVDAVQRTRKPVIARVLITNPARAFWEKMGFAVVDTTDEHHLLQRDAP